MLVPLLNYRVILFFSFFFFLMFGARFLYVIVVVVSFTSNIAVAATRVIHV